MVLWYIGSVEVGGCFGRSDSGFDILGSAGGCGIL